MSYPLVYNEPIKTRGGAYAQETINNRWNWTCSLRNK